MGGGEKKKETKKKKEMGSGVYVYGGKKGRVEKERRKKKFERENIGFICIFTLFCAKYRIVKIYLDDVYNIFYHK